MEIKEILLSEKPSIYFEMMKKENTLENYPELKALIGVKQSPIHHPEGDVWTHTMMVVDVAATLKKKAKNPFGFMLTALFHDLGKAQTTTVEEDGRIRSIGHENCLHPTRSALKRLDIDLDTTEYVLNMTKLHMRPNSLVAQKSSQKAFNKVFNASICPEDLILFSKADHLGRLNVSGYDENEKILKERLQVFYEII